MSEVVVSPMFYLHACFSALVTRFARSLAASCLFDISHGFSIAGIGSRVAKHGVLG